MIYLIIGGLILLLVFCAKFDMSFLGCLGILVIGVLLWRIGILGFILRLIFKVIRWIFIRVIYYYEKFFGSEETIQLIISNFIK